MNIVFNFLPNYTLYLKFLEVVLVIKSQIRQLLNAYLQKILGKVVKIGVTFSRKINRCQVVKIISDFEVKLLLIS